MQILETLKAIYERQPIEKIPVQWDQLSYSTESFDRETRLPQFKGWAGDRPDEEEAGIILKLLKPEEGASLLDVACGYGRHALLLAQRGLKVTGVDYSPGLIAKAKALAAERNVSADFLVRDARDLAWDGEFDLAMIGFNSFGLFSPGSAPSVLNGIRRALKPGGRLFMDLANRRAGIEYPERESNWEWDRGSLKLQEVSFRQSPCVEVCRDLYIRAAEGKVEEFLVFLRMYCRDEISALLQDCGFKLEEIFGGWDLAPMLPDSRKIVLVAQRI